MNRPWTPTWLALPALLLASWAVAQTTLSHEGPLGASSLAPAAVVLRQGPLLGRVTDTSAMVWVRLSGPAQAFLRYGESLETLRSTPVVGVQGECIARFLLRGLVPETAYVYELYVDGRKVSLPGPNAPMGRFTTFPPPGALRPFSILYLTDFARRDKITVPADESTFASAAREGFDLLFIGGDFDHMHSTTLSAFRRKYREMYDPATPGLAIFAGDLLLRGPIAHQYDDHDSGQNNADKTNPYKKMALKAYKEYVPHWPLPNPSAGIWQSLARGHVDLFILDDRSQRDPASAPDGPGKSMLDGDNLGTAGQRQWLADSLLASKAMWKVILTSVPFHRTAKAVDSWAAYPDEREWLVDFIDGHGITGVVAVAGDIHAGGIDDGRNAGLVSMIVPPADLRPCVSGGTGVGTWSEGTYGRDGAPCPGYGLLTFDAGGGLTLQVKDHDGTVRVQYAAAAP